MIPLYLKLKKKSSFDDGEFCVKQDTVEFDGKTYKFQKIFSHDESLEGLAQEEQGNGYEENSCYIFMGPTGSGKTTALRELLDYKLRVLSTPGAAKYPTFLSAFEVTNNKYATDLLERDLRFTRKEYHYHTRDIACKKVKIDHETKDELLSGIFKKRLTQQTPFNSESSRSSLIIHLIQNGKKIVYMDLMGNEKFDITTPKTSNVFANMSISSITRMLAAGNATASANSLDSSTDDPFSVRTSSIITNLIFKKNGNQKERKINICLVIDPLGDKDLNKSAFRNIAELVQHDAAAIPCTQTQLQSVKLSPLPKSPHSLTMSPPNYTKPTIASLSPIKVRKRSHLISPKRNVPASLNSQRRSLSISPVKRRNTKQTLRRIVSEPVGKISTGKVVQVVPSAHEIQIDALMKQLRDMEQQNEQLRTTSANFAEEKNQLVTHISRMEDEHELEVKSLQDQLNSSQHLIVDLTNDVQRLDTEKCAMTQHWSELKEDFSNFQNDHESFNKVVESLRFQLDEIRDINQDMSERNKDLTDELRTVRVATENLNNSNQEEIEKLEKTLETYEETIMELNNQNEALETSLEYRDTTIQKHQETEKKLTDHLLKAKEQLDTYNHDLHEAREDVSKKNNEINELTLKCSNVVSISAELDTVRSELERAKLQLEQTDDLTDKLNNAYLDLEQHKQRLNSKVAEIEKLDSELSNTKEQLSHETESLKGKLQQSIFERKDLDTKFESVNMQLDTYKLENEELTKKLAQMEREVSSSVQANLSDGVETVSFPRMLSLGAFSPPNNREQNLLPSIDFLDQFTTFSDPIFQGPQIYEDSNHSPIEDNESDSSDTEKAPEENCPAKTILGASKLENIIPENRLKRSGKHFHHPPLKSSKLRNIIYS